MPTIVQRVSNAGAQGTRWRATPNAHRRKDQTVKISAKREETTSPGWLIFTPVNWLSFIALQTKAKSFMKTLKCEEVVCCESFIGDGGRYPGVGLQGQASNRHKLRG